MIFFMQQFLGKVISFLINKKQQQVYKTYRSKYDIAGSFVFNGVGIEFYGEGQIIIGENSYVGQRSAIQSSKEARVVIGNNCSISHNVRIYTISLDPVSIIQGNKSQENTKLGNVLIGDNCWIGANVLIKENVVIGNNCVIAANSTVTRDIPGNSIAMGVPAKVVKRYNVEQQFFIKCD